MAVMLSGSTISEARIIISECISHHWRPSNSFLPLRYLDQPISEY